MQSYYVIMVVFVLCILVGGIVTGCMTQEIIKEKGYDENWFWFGFFFSFYAVAVAEHTSENRNRYAREHAEHLEKLRKQEIMSGGGWVCEGCGRMNPKHTGTCACGMTRTEQETPAKEKAALFERLRQTLIIKA